MRLEQLGFYSFDIGVSAQATKISRDEQKLNADINKGWWSEDMKTFLLSYFYIGKPCKTIKEFLNLDTKYLEEMGNRSGVFGHKALIERNLLEYLNRNQITLNPNDYPKGSLGESLASKLTVKT